MGLFTGLFESPWKDDGWTYVDYKPLGRPRTKQEWRKGNVVIVLGEPHWKSTTAPTYNLSRVGGDNGYAWSRYGLGSYKSLGEAKKAGEEFLQKGHDYERY